MRSLEEISATAGVYCDPPRKESGRSQGLLARYRATQRLVMVPMPSISVVITSPGLRNSPVATPTPDGVPVRIDWLVLAPRVGAVVGGWWLLGRLVGRLLG